MGKKVFLGMSGGVDSSVAAIILKEQGYEVIGVTLKLWEDEKNKCALSTQVSDAKKVCDKLGIEHHTFDFQELFKEKVIDNFVNEYFEGRTPNPCIECNKYLKFKQLLQKAEEMNVDYIATGHYAMVEFNEELNRYLLKKSNADKKDQTYVLYNLTQDQLKRIIFPLGTFNDKSEIREFAKKYELPVANKPDSQDICFIPSNDYHEFLETNKKQNQINEGNIVDLNGNVLGKHTGIINYTIGQRKGLGITYKEPLFVIDIDKERNEIVVGVEKETYRNELYANNLNWIMFDKLQNKMNVKAKTRYLAKQANATIEMIDNRTAKVIFDEPQKSITKGQSVVFYKDDYVVGGGIII